MKKCVLFLAALACAHASPFEILSDTVTSGSGVSGSGALESGVSVTYTLEQYERTDINGMSNLSLPVYLRYSYQFSAPAAFTTLFLTLPEDCSSDSECVFGIETDGPAWAVDPVRLYTSAETLTQAIYGIRIRDLSPAPAAFRLSLFSNRIPDGLGRIAGTGTTGQFNSDPGSVITPETRLLVQADTPSDAPVPEPVSLSLVAGGTAAMYLLRRRCAA